MVPLDKLKLYWNILEYTITILVITFYFSIVFEVRFCGSIVILGSDEFLSWSSEKVFYFIYPETLSSKNTVFFFWF